MNNLTQEEQPNGSSRNDEKNNDSPQWNGRCYARARPKSSRPSPPSSPRDENPRTTRNVTRTKPLFHEPTPSNSYRRGRCNVEAEVYPLVVARRRSTACRRGQKEGGAPWRHVAGGPRHPHTHTSYSWLQGTRGRSLHHHHHRIATSKGRRTPTRRHGY